MGKEAYQKMKLASMQYKGYCWPHNPRVYTMDYERLVVVHKVPLWGNQLQDLGPKRRVMAGEGEFVGEGAYEEFGRLANVFYSGGAGLLVHPLWMPTMAHLVSLRVEQEPRPDYVKYSFVFWEDSTPYGGVTSLDGGGSTSSGGASGDAVQTRQVHTVRRGETMWGIAVKYGLSLQSLLARNPQIKNPNLIFVGDEVNIS